jgi:hypothetical protein
MLLIGLSAPAGCSSRACRNGGRDEPDHDDGFETAYEASAEIHALLAYARSLDNQCARYRGGGACDRHGDRSGTAVCEGQLHDPGDYQHGCRVSCVHGSLEPAAPLQGAIVAGICAGVGAGSTGLILVPWDVLARHVRAFARRWRRP